MIKLTLIFPEQHINKVKNILDKEIEKQRKESEKINKSMKARLLRKMYPNFSMPSNFLSYQVLEDSKIEAEINLGMAEKMINPSVVVEPLKETFNNEIGDNIIKISISC